MSSTDPKDGVYKELRSLPKHNQKPDCPLCKYNKETFGSTVKVCYQSESPNPGEQTRTFS